MSLQFLSSLIFILIGFSVFSQIDSNPTSKVTTTPEHLQKRGSFTVDFGLLGSSLSYDWRITPELSLRGDVGIGGRILSWGPIWNLTDTKDYYLAIHPNYSLATRYYYNHARVVASDFKKSTKFFALKLNCIPPWFIQTVKSRRGWPRPTAPGILELVPQWGFRTTKQRIYFEFNLGYAFPFKGIFPDQEYEDSRINVLARVGYRI